MLVFALAKQLDEVEELEDFALLQYELAFAAFFLVVLVARYWFMRTTQPTALGDDTPPRARLMARAVHLGMYLGLGGVAISGLGIGALYAAEVKAGTMMDAALLAHEIFVNGTYLLIAMHIAAAFHHRHKGSGIWDSMVPFWKERRGED